ncbi:MAG: FMN-binding negative transcriptional regulator [Planctomycetaceae bacterium]
MYTPRAFAEERLDLLHGFMERHSFGTLVWAAEGRVEASHLPLRLDRSIGRHGQLLGHMARANSQWKSADGGRVLVIFHGPHAYISPTWYEAEDTVPTWNYVAVHATGTFHVIDDRERLREIVRLTVDAYEAALPVPWTMDHMEAAFADQLLHEIVGFAVEIETLEGKWKLNQNHPRDRRERVIRALRLRPGEAEQQIAQLMETQWVESGGP